MTYLCIQGPVMDGRLNKSILVLNRLWQAVNIVGVKRAFGLMFQDHAKVIHVESGDFLVLNSTEWIDFSQSHQTLREDDMMHTVRLRIRIPKVILLNYYDRLPLKEVRFSRQNLFQRDHHTCQYCGHVYNHSDLNFDHIIPRDRGGKTTWENIVTSCIRCNTRKGNRLPHEAGMRLRRKPVRPKLRPFVSFAVNSDMEEAWEQFIPQSTS